jgi:hypothetical protein
MPSLQQQQNSKSPVGASSSKSGNLLRNTFSMEVYQEFLKFKTDKANQKREAATIEKEMDEIRQRIL